ncbi:sugar phosphate isomerase/epimerase family protein [Paenibacillus sp. FSL H8-0034]|uniref:sugar phosphate isomerase/epimerase family protein n=1 Tax=Paenibacillus sp. FSL H8-0034 TaxID=2954671 RepID=UPI0030F9A4FD
MNMRKGNECLISTYALADISLDEAVNHLINEGCKAIEIMCEGRHGELLDWPQERLNELKQLGDENQIIWTIHAPIANLNLAAEEEELIQSNTELLLRTLQIAELLECAYVVLHPGELSRDKVDQDSASHEAALRIAAFLQEIVNETEGSQVILALENVPPYPGLLGTDSVFLKKVIHLVQSRRVKIVYDVGHMHLMGEGRCEQSFQSLLPFITSIHLSDNLGQHDDHLRLGAGTVPLKSVLAMANEYGYSGAWVLEMSNMNDIRLSQEWLGH